MRVGGKGHRNRVVHGMSHQPVQVHVRCKSRVHRDGRTDQPTAVNADNFTTWATLIQTRKNINSWSVDHQYGIVSFLSQQFEKAEAANSSKIRDRSPLVRKMSYRTIHPKKSGTRVRFFSCQLRRGVPPTQRQLHSDTEVQAWDSTSCARDTHSFPQQKMWRR